MVSIEDYAARFFDAFPFVPRGGAPWAVVAALAERLAARRADDPAYDERTPLVWVHRSAIVEAGATIKPPALIGPGCRIAAHAYLRGGVALGPGVVVGPGVEVKASLVMGGSTLAHLNFVGDSVIGAGVNIEAGAVIANHWNERADKAIAVRAGGLLVATGAVKFGALIGDNCRIGANAVLSPGTLLTPGTVVARLQLVDQSGG